MKLIRWKILLLSSVVCLLPILLGVYLWYELPDVIAIHFDLYNNPDNFASKGFVVFGLPSLMAILQCICCVITDINAHTHGNEKSVTLVTKWIIPVLSVVLQLVTLEYGLGKGIDIRRVVMMVVGVTFLVTGTMLPKLDYVKNTKLDAPKAKKINRFVGYETVILGILFCISSFFPPIVSVACLVLLIPYTILGVCYGITVARG